MQGASSCFSQAIHLLRLLFDRHSHILWLVFNEHAQVAELADALASGASGSNPVQVRFLSWAISYAETSYVTR